MISDSTVTQLWSPITLKNPVNVGDMFSETSVLIRAKRCKVPHRHESIPEDGVVGPYIVSFYGETDHQRCHGNTTVETYHPEEP
jgi:hypothetical protein